MESDRSVPQRWGAGARSHRVRASSAIPTASAIQRQIALHLDSIAALWQPHVLGMSLPKQRRGYRISEEGSPGSRFPSISGLGRTAHTLPNWTSSPASIQRE